jgi:hypothetical protein
VEGRHHTGDPGQAGGDLVTGGWWRRNWWGLVALVPALVLAFYAPVKDLDDRYGSGQPRQPVGSVPGGWVEYGGARMRLVDLGRADDVKTYDGRPVTFAGGERIWRATLEFAAQDPDTIGGCELLLESSAGSTFSNDPMELDQASANVVDRGCLPDILAPPAPGAPYRADSYFVVPSTARPVAVRVMLPTKLPRYARLAPP